jgi:hypothetical protein
LNSLSRTEFEIIVEISCKGIESGRLANAAFETYRRDDGVLFGTELIDFRSDLFCGFCFELVDGRA